MKILVPIIMGLALAGLISSCGDDPDTRTTKFDEVDNCQTVTHREGGKEIEESICTDSENGEGYVTPPRIND